MSLCPRMQFARSYPLRYLTYNFCLSILLVKVLLISNAFRVPILTSLEFTSLPNKAQVGIVIASLALLLSVLFPWLLLDPPFNMRHIYPKRHTFNECKAYSRSVGKSLFLATSKPTIFCGVFSVKYPKKNY